jgi:hypothetical protein
MKEAIIFKYEIVAVEEDSGLNEVRVIDDRTNRLAGSRITCIEDRKARVFGIYIDQSPRLPTI